MVNKRISLKELQRAVARARAKAKTASERIQLERELKALREGTNIKLLRRLGRGFVILTKKGAKATGQGIVKARKFAEETGAGEGLDIELASSIQRPISRKAVRTTRVVRIRRRPRTRVVVTRKVTTRRVRIRPRKRRAIKRDVRRGVARRTQQDTGDFFGGLSDLGI